MSLFQNIIQKIATKNRKMSGNNKKRKILVTNITKICIFIAIKNNKYFIFKSARNLKSCFFQLKILKITFFSRKVKLKRKSKK